jgi:hypothetical protein
MGVSQMNSFIAELIQGIQRNDEEAFIGASEVAAGSCVGFDKYEAIEPYSERLTGISLTSTDIDALKNALIEYIKNSNGAAISAIFALGKFNDPALVPMLRKLLLNRLCLLLDYKAAVSNLLCGLDNLGEKAISDNSHSYINIEKLINDATEYLERCGYEIAR